MDYLHNQTENGILQIKNTTCNQRVDIKVLSSRFQDKSALSRFLNLPGALNAATMAEKKAILSDYFHPEWDLIIFIYFLPGEEQVCWCVLSQALSKQGNLHNSKIKDS